MPIYAYEPRDAGRACPHCRAGFEQMQRMADAPLKTCPECGAPVRRVVAAPSVGSSKTSLDRRAKDAGFHQLKKLGTGEYEKTY
ncbi:MAG: zinc ribbon domain-containing protein [Kiritimatiellae bacterium]|nr:zinc ribbon domain-containing protein [Kiritimatiellia bacterium]